MKTDRSPEAARRQVESVRSVYLPPEVYDRVEKYAEDNGMAVSEVMRDAMRTYTTGNVPEGRSRRTRRVTMWVNLTEFVAFRKAVEKHKTTQAAAIESALESIL